MVLLFPMLMFRSDANSLSIVPELCLTGYQSKETVICVIDTLLTNVSLVFNIRTYTLVNLTNLLVSC